MSCEFEKDHIKVKQKQRMSTSDTIKQIYIDNRHYTI